MFLIPFVRNHKSYSVETKEDTSIAEEQLKKWLENIKKNKEIANQLHEEALRKFGE